MDARSLRLRKRLIPGKQLGRVVYRPVFGIAALLLLAVSSQAQGPAPESLPDAPTDQTLTVRLVDALGKPVPDTRIGFSACFGDLSYKNPRWHYLPDPASLDPDPAEIVTDGQGVARIPQGLRIRSIAPRVLIARNEKLRLIGIKALERDSAAEVILTMVPECRVSGKLVCPSLSDAGETLQRINLNVHHEGAKFVVEYYSTTPEFELFLPAGTYQVASNGGGNGTLNAQRELVVPVGVASLDLYPIELATAARRTLIGRPAPELKQVIAWKSDGPKSLADLRGKVVLLDFWGYWCASCIAGIPKLIDLHEQYSDQGLVIVGLHVDAGERITDLKSYAEYETSLMSGALKGRAIPYPIALLADDPTPHAGTTQEATCRVAADYGIQSYPTMILIDRQGRVAGEFHHTPEGLVGLRRLLAERGSKE